MFSRHRNLSRFLTEVLDWSREGCCSQPCNTQGLSGTCSCARCTVHQKVLLRCCEAVSPSVPQLNLAVSHWLPGTEELPTLSAFYFVLHFLQEAFQLLHQLLATVWVESSF